MATRSDRGGRDCPPGPAQRRALRWVLGYLTREGRPPSLRELAAGLGCHHTNAGWLLERLERRGLLLLPKRAEARPAWGSGHHPAQPEGGKMARTMSLPGAPMRRTPAGLIPVVDPSTPAGKALLLAITEVPS